jgi:Uncharacterized protein conserved in bacteria
MIESVIMFLIYVCLLAIVIYAVVYVLRDVIGLPIPAKIIQILWVIVALLVLLWLVQLILGGGGLSLPRFGRP